MLLYKGLYNMYLNYFNQQIDGIIVLLMIILIEYSAMHFK